MESHLMSEIDKSFIGAWSDPFIVYVEKGAIRKFADAIGDPHILYRDEAYAQMQGYPSVVAPPTFPTCFRPVVQPPWFDNLDRRRIVAGEISFEYERPVTAGMQLVCRVQLTGVEEKSGAKGAMQLIHQETHGKDASGELVFISRRTTIYRSLDQVQKGSLA